MLLRIEKERKEEEAAGAVIVRGTRVGERRVTGEQRLEKTRDESPVSQTTRPQIRASFSNSSIFCLTTFVFLSSSVVLSLTSSLPLDQQVTELHSCPNPQCGFFLKKTLKRKVRYSEAFGRKRGFAVRFWQSKGQTRVRDRRESTGRRSPNDNGLTCLG